MSKYISIKENDIANGDGVRISIFFSGCPHHCYNCFNQESWNKDNGEFFTEETIQYILSVLQRKHIKGLSILGGEPFAEYNIKNVEKLCSNVKKFFPNKDIWVWTGYNMNEIKDISFLKNIDYIIDGKYIDSLKNYKLKYRGSKNQKIYKNINGIFIEQEIKGE